MATGSVSSTRECFSLAQEGFYGLAFVCFFLFFFYLFLDDGLGLAGRNDDPVAVTALEKDETRRSAPGLGFRVDQQILWESETSFFVLKSIIVSFPAERSRLQRSK